MADQFSFDVVSQVNFQEVKNAIEHATKEIRQRFDFKDSKTEQSLPVNWQRRSCCRTSWCQRMARSLLFRSSARWIAQSWQRRFAKLMKLPSYARQHFWQGSASKSPA